MIKISIKPEISKKLTELEKAIKETEIEFKKYAMKNSWKSEIEKKAGWYFIKTNMPVKDMAELNHDNDNSEGHINIADTLKATQILGKNGFAIAQKDNEPYIVYNGEHFKLLQRINEHVKGSKGTGCLALSKYEDVKRFKWWVSWALVSDIFPFDDNKAIRVLLEQAWRIKNGWPCLCKK